MFQAPKVTAPNLPSNLSDYDKFRHEFSWDKDLLPEDKSSGVNIAYLCVDRFAEGPSGQQTALRFIKKDSTISNISYSDLKSHTARFANVLDQLGIRKGDRVFSLCGRVPELYVSAMGALKKNAVFCPLFSVFGPEPIWQRLSRGDASVLVTTTALFEKKVKALWSRLPSLKYVLLTDSPLHTDEKILSYPQLMSGASDKYTIPYTDPETPALLHFTSGTTGMPKGALHIHKAVYMHYLTGKYVLDFHPGDIFWCTADPGWVTGTSYGIIAPLVNGITNIIVEEEFDMELWYSILEKQKVSVWYTAPTAIRRLMRSTVIPKEKYDLEHLRQICSVGEPLDAEAVNWAQRAFGVPVLDNWWQTETGGIMIANFPSMKVKPGSMGKPLPGIDAAIAEVTEKDLKIMNEPGKKGQLILKKGWPSMFREYLHEEERYKKCFRDEWYLTGDLVKRDADGYFWFIGRADDIIKTSGHMVGPFEVESTLVTHPAVAEAAVIGKPDAAIGELVKAFVVLKSGYPADEGTSSDIMGFARKKLGPAVAPKEISFIEQLPKTKSGKILRRLLRSRELGLPEGDISTLEQNP